MTKRLIDVDDDLLDKARLALGTKTMKDTVNAALEEVVEARRERIKAGLDHLAQLAREGVLIDRDEIWR